MAGTVEVLKERTWGSPTSNAWEPACIDGATAFGMEVTRRARYEGRSDWLTLFGAGHPAYSQARDAHIASGRPVAIWDVGYLGKSEDKSRTYFRVCLNANHPSHAYMERTFPDPSRWNRLLLKLAEVADPRGPVLVIGIGVKSRVILGNDWEQKALASAAERFPDRKIIYRPKLSRGVVDDTVKWPHRALHPYIYDALQGASLVICRHSNVAIDACIAGVPVECEDGAAHWLYSRGANPSVQQRLDFLYRVCWWQWRAKEMALAWHFLAAIA